MSKKTKVPDDVVMAIRRADLEGASPTEQAREYGLSYSRVYSIIKGTSYRHLPYVELVQRRLRCCPHCGSMVWVKGGQFRNHVRDCEGPMPARRACLVPRLPETFVSVAPEDYQPEPATTG